MQISDLPQNFLDNLLKHLSIDGMIAASLSGSYARGSASTNSDIDITIFVEANKQDSRHYSKQIFEEKLISVLVTTFAIEMAKFKDPETALFMIPAARQSVSVSDPNERFAEFQRFANAFEWQTVQEQANILVSQKLAKHVEEVLKLIDSKGQDPYKQVASLNFLVMGMSWVVALAKGTFITNESTFHQQVEEVMGNDSEWTKLHKVALGLEATDLSTRSQTGIDLYKETVNQFNDLILPEDKIIIDFALHRLG